jgi:uncharacterized protein (DUF433 family)
MTPMDLLSRVNTWLEVMNGQGGFHCLENSQEAVIILSMDYSKIITIEPGKRNGKPTIRGTRMTVTDVLEYLASGMTEDEILADFPDLTADDIKACLAFAADRERKLAMIPENETTV